MSAEDEDERKVDQPLWTTVLADIETQKLKSPIDFNIANMTVKKLPKLIWCNYQVPPKRLKLTNIGKTAQNGIGRCHSLLADHSRQNTFFPKFTFIGVPTIWKEANIPWMEEDLVYSSISLPMELHAVHFKSDYLTQEAAVRESDGISVLVYFFKIQTTENPKMKAIVKTLQSVRDPFSSTRPVPWPMSNLLRPFENDYFFYRGWLSAGVYASDRNVLWLTSREPIGISWEQIAAFRTLKKTDEKLCRNTPVEQNTGNRNAYHINPSGTTYASLLLIPTEPAPSGTTSVTACCEKDVEEIKKSEE